MSWTIEFYKGVEDQILAMPAKLQARMLKLLELIEKHGANLGPPHTESLKEGLFEIRAKAEEGIARSLFCYCVGKRIVVVHAFVKKSQQTPKKEIDLARARKKEMGL